MTYDKLFEPGKPCFFVVNMDILDFDALSRYLSATYQGSIVRFIRGDKSKTVPDFFDEIAAALQFPLYFGENWNAFYDCIIDLDWTDGSAYILLVSHSSSLLSDADNEDFEALIRILSKANEDWTEPNKYIPRGRSSTPFHVIFQCSATDVSTFSDRLARLEPQFDTL